MSTFNRIQEKIDNLLEQHTELEISYQNKRKGEVYYKRYAQIQNKINHEKAKLDSLGHGFIIRVTFNRPIEYKSRDILLESKVNQVMYFTNITEAESRVLVLSKYPKSKIIDVTTIPTKIAFEEELPNH